MFSKKGFKLLEESTAEVSYGSISNSALEDVSSHFQPRHQGPPDGRDSPPIDPRRTLSTCSCPEFSCAYPIRSDDQVNDLADGQQATDEQEMDVPLATCATLVSFYKNTAITLRNSFFIHIFQVIFCLIQISAIVMGALFDGKCMEYELLPAYGGVTGFTGLVFTGLWMSISCYHRLEGSSSESHKLLFGAFFSMFLISVILDMSFFGALAYSYDEITNCSKTFYDYAFYKHIATGVSAILAALLYLPGSLQCLYSLIVS